MDEQEQDDMSLQPGKATNNPSSCWISVFAVIKCTASAVRRCGKTSAGNYCNSESQRDTPCKLIPENPDAHTQRHSSVSTPVRTAELG